MNEAKEEEIRLFVGENAYYYLIKWSKMADKGNIISWNWPMAAFGVAWLGARKMFLYMFIVLLLWVITNVILLGIDLPTAAISAWLLFSILLGIFGNHLYLSSVKQKIAKIKREIRDPELQKSKMAKKGGVNYIIFILMLVGIPLISILVRALKGTI
jgi:hypothetical protein